MTNISSKYEENNEILVYFNKNEFLLKNYVSMKI